MAKIGEELSPPPPLCMLSLSPCSYPQEPLVTSGAEHAPKELSLEMNVVCYWEVTLIMLLRGLK